MKKYIKKTLIILASILMFMSTCSGFQDISAKRYHYKTHRSYRLHNRNHYRRRKFHKHHKARKNYKSHKIYKKHHATKWDKELAQALKYAPRSIRRLPLSEKQIRNIQQAIDYGGEDRIPNEKGEILSEIVYGAKPSKAYKYANRYYKSSKMKPSRGEDNFCAALINSPKDRFIGGSSATDPRTHTKAQVKENMENEIKNITLHDLNKDRASLGESNLEDCWDLNDTAKERSRELVNDFSHENSNGQYASDEDDNIDSENIAYETLPDGSDNDDISAKAANDLNKMLFYDEEPSDGGHFQDIRDHAQVGAGATIANGNVYLAEDFAE